MARATYSVLYFINRTKLNKDGKATISARITLNNQKTEFTTGRLVDPETWMQEAGRVDGTSKEVKEINSYLGLIKSNLLLKKRELEEQGHELTALTLKNAYM